MLMNVKVNNFSVDLQNGIGTFNVQTIDDRGMYINQWANLAVRVSNVESKTGAQVKAEAIDEAVKFIEQVRLSLLSYR